MNLTHRINRRAFMVGAGGSLVVAPSVLRAQAKTIRVGMPTVLSGTAAQLGANSRNAAQMGIDELNAAGGLAGRTIELVVRDSKAQPQEAARIVRELVNADGCELILSAEPNALAVQEIIRDLGVLCIHTTPETTSLTADPKNRVPTSFRCARQGIHDSIAGGAYAAAIAKANRLTKWTSISPDYAYGRDTTALFFEWLKHFHPDIEVSSQVWPRLGTPDFSEAITRLLQAKPQGLYSTLWGGDLTSFVSQAGIYGLFNQMQTFAVNLADYNVLLALKSLPKGIHSGTRYLDNFPETAANKAWCDAYRARFNQLPTIWAAENYLAVQFLAAASKSAGSADGKAMAEALRAGMTIDSAFGADGKVTMRSEDQTIVGYATGWGVTISNAPYVTDIKSGDWGMIRELEADWKHRNGFA